MEFEYLIVPPGPIVGQSWENVYIDIETSDELIGFRANTRLRNPLGPQGTQYPPFEVVEQTIEVISHDLTEPATFTAAPGSQGILGGYVVAGIVDGERYIYEEVFDQSNFKYVERLSGNFQDNYVGEVPAGPNGLPDEPYYPIEHIYPMDSVTQFIPDTREFVTVQYQLTTTVTSFGVQYTGSIIIYHNIYQDMWEWGPYLKDQINKTYYANGIYKSAGSN